SGTKPAGKSFPIGLGPTAWSSSLFASAFKFMLAVGPPMFSDDLARIGVAALLGGVIGLEREWKGHWAGLRTHILVAMGCAIFMIAGMDIVGRESEAVTRVI